MLGANEISIVFGMRGCGKSTLTREISSIHARRVVIDRLREWDDPNQETVSNFNEFCEWWVNNYHRDEFTVVCQFSLGSSMEANSAEFDSILRTVYLTERESPYPRGICLVVEEIHFWSSPYSLSDWLTECVYTGRHAGISIVANAQRPASVHKSLVALSTNVFVGASFETNDLKYLTDAIGDVVYQAKSLEKYHFLWHRYGEMPRIVKTTL